MSALRVVRVEGDARSRGRAVGEQLGDLVRRSLAFYRGYFKRRDADVEALAAPFRRAAEKALPDLVAWLDGLAEGAAVAPAEVFAVNAMEELEPLLAPAVAVEQCSTFTAVAPGATILGHNEMWLAGDAGNAAVVVEAPESGPPIASPTVACCLPAVGLNGHRMAQGIDSLTAADDRVGVPRVLVSRHALDAADRVDATRRANLLGRAGGYAHVFAQAGGDAFALETTALRADLLEGPGAHTNHYLSEELAPLGHEPSAGSLARRERLRALLAEQPPGTPEDAMTLLRDHDSRPQSICEHGDERLGLEASTVVFSMVCELESGRMWVAPGNPCENEYEEVDLAGVV